MQLSNVYEVALWGFLLAAGFGALSQYSQFCTMGAISDWLHMGDTTRLRAWFLAIGVAIIGVQALKWLTPIDFQRSIYLAPRFGWLGHLLGGALFGIGMTLASGCSQRTLVRAGGGNLKSLVVLLVLAVTAYMTLRGLLAFVRIDVVEAASIDLAAHGMADQSIPGIFAGLVGVEHSATLDAVVAVAVGGLFIGAVFSARAFRRRFDQIFAGVGIGLIVVAGWYVTGVVGFDDVEPVRLESYAYVAPVAESLRYLLTFTGATMGFGVAAVFGTLFGSFAYAVVSGSFRIEGFASNSDLIAHLAGAASMGFGGVLAIGCTIGQGIAGMSTLALGSLLTLVSIMFGAALTMKMQYHLLDHVGFPRALGLALADLRPRPARRRRSV